VFLFFRFSDVFIEKVLGITSVIKKTTQNKQPPNRRKIAQFGHTGDFGSLNTTKKFIEF
jgi:hypothetical protein